MIIKIVHVGRVITFETKDEGELFAKTEAGVPQGGIISPLLANVYLNEFDKWAEKR